VFGSKPNRCRRHPIRTGLPLLLPILWQRSSAASLTPDRLNNAAPTPLLPRDADGLEPASSGPDKAYVFFPVCSLCSLRLCDFCDSHDVDFTSLSRLTAPRMTNALSSLTLAQLRRAVEVKEQIETLQNEINQILGAPSEARVLPRGRVSARGRKRYGAAARAKFAAAQRARRARERGAATAPVSNLTVRRKRKKLSPAARARISAAAKARWARARAAGKI